MNFRNLITQKLMIFSFIIVAQEYLHTFRVIGNNNATLSNVIIKNLEYASDKRSKLKGCEGKLLLGEAIDHDLELLRCGTMQSNYHIPGFLNGKIISTEKINYPVYSEIKGIRNYYDSITYNIAINDKTVKTEKLTYLSDGLKVVAYLSTPRLLKNKTYPVIIFNRGSLVRNDIAYVHRPLFTKLVKAGFIVLAPSLRESEGSEGKDEFGGKEVNDILNTLPLLASLNFSDTSQIFMIGESRGGIMSYLSLKAGFPAKAVATIGAITDLNDFIHENPDLDNIAKQFIPDYSENKEQLLKERSVLNWAEKINCPILILHGQNDKQVKPKNAISLALKLSELEKKYQLLILNDGNHMLSNKFSNERDRQILEWFNIHK